MQYNKISSAVVFPKLGQILNEDIEVLQNLKEKAEDENQADLLDSLIDAKKEILSKFPSGDESLSSGATPPQRLHVVGYNSSKTTDISNLISMLHGIEKEQMKFVQDYVEDEGMPDELLNKLEEILAIYSQITEQLGRSSKTSQYNRIVI